MMIKRKRSTLIGSRKVIRIKREKPQILETPTDNFEDIWPELIDALTTYYGGHDWGQTDPDWASVAMGLAMEYLPAFQVPATKKPPGTNPETLNDLLFVSEMQKRISKGDSIGKAAKNVAKKFPELAKTQRAAQDKYRNIRKDKNRFLRLIYLYETLGPQNN
ncbi:MAG: hypothetical protein HOL66_03070 [Rhodospirillaceae bacterium]|jgi:hypothetical protein|nr:hypothetical protein [Rhodospirillaceae bacterium]MBT5243208.1 hypothetical protein [Rhodospirillaceae bacterium]MBT6243747.1 hypothetical protein [Rhodospirillaceae bacterium]MBT7942812.1 hypothetical protein [Alphaproteobacteria bacterium]